MKFNLTDGRARLYQWDSDVILAFPELADGTEVHFAASSALSIKRTVEDGVAMIPNILLQRNRNILMFVFREDATRDEGEIEVVGRPKPPDYVYTDQEKLTWQMLEDRLDTELTDIKSTQSSHAKQIISLNAAKTLFVPIYGNEINGYNAGKSKSSIDTALDGGAQVVAYVPCMNEYPYVGESDNSVWCYVPFDNVADGVYTFSGFVYLEDYIPRYCCIELGNLPDGSFGVLYAALKPFVLTVNGNLPDESGNVEVVISDSTQNVDINSVALWEQSSIGGTGANSGATNYYRIRTITYIPGNVAEISVAEGYEYAMVCYNADGAVKSGNAYFNFTTGTFSTTGAVYTADSTNLEVVRAAVGDYSNFRLMLKNASGAEVEITTDEAVNLSLFTGGSGGSSIPQIVSEDGGAVVRNDINADNPIWEQWNKRLAFGMAPGEARVPFLVDGQMLVEGTLMVHNNTGNDIAGAHDRNRWGFHVLEAFLRDNYSRWTVLTDKHTHDNKPMLEDYLYTGADHTAASYGWRKIGSDAKDHSFLFDRDVMLALGAIRCYSPFSLARIAPSTDLDYTYETVAEADDAYNPQNQATENMRCVRGIEVANAGDGCMYYDTESQKIVVKSAGVWTYLLTAGNSYTRDEVDAIMGSYINDIDALLGGDE